MNVLNIERINMLAWIWNIVVGQFCRHKWEIIDQGGVYGSDLNKPLYIRYYLQCEKCGNIKKKN